VCDWISLPFNVSARPRSIFSTQHLEVHLKKLVEICVLSIAYLRNLPLVEICVLSIAYL